LFRIAPSSLLRIALQHGYECVGFLHNQAHSRAHGQDITFAADVICGWCEPSALDSVTWTQRSKLFVSGPPSVLRDAHPNESSIPLAARPRRGGLVCENLHSVRFRAA